ncbi:DNA-methyltransferase [Leptospira santarosai]|uniref:DNA-methyltransferase n=1 Tax=Leptospira santarosai TaxID=28183 RepID=UPI0002BE6C97|nr:site-specific DNA-methyltransferase [Leptospira santarosai]EMO70505.1 DNA methylase family protein [Leptospira santarosai str. 200403458]EMO97673.1 DNA methylase family protein [Leptospira santarosai str. 200702252]EMP81497.1 DNA methylase family protein [Leptospira santarosai str. CBC1531]MDI7182734.1 site-specific DNA-methyltransferase [Leptospira santarosai]
MKRTTHRIQFRDSRETFPLEPESVDLVLTSPPYPMIEMWDELFFGFSKEIRESFPTDPNLSYEKIHTELDKVWKESFRVLKNGGFLVINVGDATRNTSAGFRIYMNHARILQGCSSIGFQSLPGILWRKQTNSPNKFMGSGMLPAGAYVTLEHEHILIFRKNNKRKFVTKAERLARAESAFFWEERNFWFTDLWDFKGKKQTLSPLAGRERSAAYPLELANRIILMYSLKGDVVLDPFLGTGTTTLAAIGNCRNSIGFDLDPGLFQTQFENLSSLGERLNRIVEKRKRDHDLFVQTRQGEGKPLLHFNQNLQTPVVTKQETFLNLERIVELLRNSDEEIVATYSPLFSALPPQPEPVQAVQPTVTRF